MLPPLRRLPPARWARRPPPAAHAGPRRLTARYTRSPPCPRRTLLAAPRGARCQQSAAQEADEKKKKTKNTKTKTKTKEKAYQRVATERAAA